MDKFCLTVINTGFRHNSNIDVFNFIFFLFSYNFYFFFIRSNFGCFTDGAYSFLLIYYILFQLFYDDLIFFQLSHKMHFRN